MHSTQRTEDTSAYSHSTNLAKNPVKLISFMYLAKHQLKEQMKEMIEPANCVLYFIITI